MKIEVVTNTEMLAQALLIRKKVFVKEQNVPLEIEIDEFEESATHFLVINDNNMPIATSRMRNVKGKAKIERVCVLAEYRQLHIGKKLMQFMEKIAIKNQFKVLVLSAQIQAVQFYQKLGYKVCSGIFFDAGIEHCKMEKQL